MKISVKNYGPIKRADNVELRPLTVFVGPSNTGKSYLAILIYALFKSFLAQRKLAFSVLEDSSKDIVEALKKLAGEKGKNVKFADLPDWVKKVCNEKFSQLANDAFHYQITTGMGFSSRENPLTSGGFSLSASDGKPKKH